MNILVTGAQGFIGRKISKFFVEKKINVYGIGRNKLNNFQIKKIRFKKIINGQINPKNLRKLILIGIEPSTKNRKSLLFTVGMLA